MPLPDYLDIEKLPDSTTPQGTVQTTVYPEGYKDPDNPDWTPTPGLEYMDIGMLPDKVPPGSNDPAPFDIDYHINEESKTMPIEESGGFGDAISNALHWFTRPFLAEGYETAAGLNRGMASFSAHLDAVGDYIGLVLGQNKDTGKGGIFEKAAEQCESNATYWKKRAKQVGTGFFEELIGEAVGGLVPGITQFSLDLASGLTFPFMAGYTQSKEDHFMNGVLEAAKTGTLAKLFKITAPLKQYLRAPTQGTIFGLQEMEGAEKGKKGKAFAKGFLTGAGYSLTSPGGQMGLNEIGEGVKPIIDKYKNSEILSNQRGSISIGPKKEKKQRKFLKTISESLSTTPELKDKVKEIDPQEYIVQPNAESLEAAKKRIDKDGIDKAVDYVKSDAALSSEKGATFIEMIDRAQKAGDFDRAVELTEAYDIQLREAGRFVQAASIWNRLTPNGFIRWVEKQMASTRSKYGWMDTIFKNKPETFSLSAEEKTDIMKKLLDINKMPDGIDKTDAMLGLIDTVAKKVPPSVSELLDAYRYQNMLSSPKTSERNIYENTGNTFLTRPIDIVTVGAIDYIKSGVFGKERKAYVDDAPVYLKTAFNAIPNAAKAFMQVMKGERGYDLGKPEIGVEAKTDFEKARFEQIPKYLTFVQRVLEAQDKFYSAIIGAGEFAIQKKRGASDADAYKAGNQISQEYLYRDQLNPDNPKLSYPSKVLSGIGDIVTYGGKQLPFLRWFVPFIRTPVNKGIQMIEHSPLGIVRGKLNDEAIAKVIGGGIVTAIGAIFAYEGQATWSAPIDPKEKEIFYASGRKPFSVKMGEYWVPVWYLGPYALAFALPTAVKHYTHEQKKALTNSDIDKILDIASGTAKFIGSQTSTQSIGSLFSALSGDMDYTFPATAAFTVEQMVPLDGLVRFTNTILDPVYKKPKSFWENIEKDLPILSESVGVRKNLYGEDQKRSGINYFVPYDIGKDEPSISVLLPSIRETLRQNNIKREIDKISEKLNDNEITAEEYFERYTELIEAIPKSNDMFLDELQNQ